MAVSRKVSANVAARTNRSYLAAMLRFIARFTGYWLVAAALVVAVVDGAKSIAASALVLTPLGETWAALAGLGAPEDGASPAAAAAPLPWPLDAAWTWLLAAPTAAVLAVLGFLLLAAGRKRRRAFLGREYA
jgi:hypothetical protein